MESIIHKANSRGHANHGWLDSYHTFSFAGYHDPERVHFGALRVLNDDTVEGGKGFGTHPHDNMEIISIPTSGDLEHQDSMGNTQVIRQGDVQVMSAGSGVRHSEYNLEPVRTTLFQIWIEPTKDGGEPAWGAKPFPKGDRSGSLVTLASGFKADSDALPIRADARATHQSVVTAMDVVGRLGFRAINIATVNEPAAAAR